MTETKKSGNLFRAAVYVLFAAFYLWLAAQIPYTHDDWDWGLDIGMKQWLNATVNSRYVGNFFEIIMTRSELVKILIMGAGFFLLPFLLSTITFSGKENRTSKNKVLGFILCNVLILSMHRTTWQQTYGWVAGYANFGISAIFLSVILRQLLKVFEHDAAQPDKLSFHTAMLFLISLAGQLFIENIALYVCLTSTLVNVIYWRRAKRFSWNYFAIFLASVTGLIIMFSSNIYSILWSTGEAVGGARHLLFHAGTDIKTAVLSCLYQLSELPFSLYAKNISICITIMVLMTVLLLQKQSLGLWKKMIGCGVNAAVCLAVILANLLGEAGFIVSVGFFAVVSIELIVLFKSQKEQLWKLIFVWISPVCIILPLIFTSELGARLFFTPSVLLIFFLMMLFYHAVAPLKRKGLFWAVSCILACALLIQYGTVYYAIGTCKRHRDAIVEDAVAAGAETIFIPGYPYSEYIWLPDPEVRETFFKDFYGIPRDVSVEFGS